MYTDQDLLKLAGKLANACALVVQANALNLSSRIEFMRDSLDEYDRAMFQATEERRVK